MRLFLAFFISASILVSTLAYTKFTDSVIYKPVEVEPELDNSNWSVLIDRTFDCVPDPAMEAPAILVQFKGHDIYRSDKSISASEQIYIQELKEVEQGDNDIFIEATLFTLDELGELTDWNPQALRVQFNRGNEKFAEQTVWLDQESSNLMETFRFKVPAAISLSESDEDHEHPH